LLAVLLIAALMPASAQAAFPGQNGKIAFVSTRDGNAEIYTMNADGGGVTRLTNDGRADCAPKWSPDGRRIAFLSNRGLAPDLTRCNFGQDLELYVMNGDGTGVTRVTTVFRAINNPAWSPDGSKIAFVALTGGDIDLYSVHPDGTGLAPILVGDGLPGYPAWSPDGTEIAIRLVGDAFPEAVYTVRPDGTGLTRRSPIGTLFGPDWSPDGSMIAYDESNSIAVINRDGSNFHYLPRVGNQSSDFPAWSPDGNRIVLNAGGTPYGGGGNTNIYTINPDGSGVTQLTNTGLDDIQPSWQPTSSTGPGYPRPKGATPFKVSLVIAYKQCLAATHQHGPPLAAPSCSPPQQASDYLTVGTLDSNAQPSKAVGSYRLDAIPGNLATPIDEADVKMTFLLGDVRKKADLSDYVGELYVGGSWRFTDRYNGPIGGGGGSEPATGSDLPFLPINATCTATADATIGSACNATTSADAVVPGSIREGKRMLSELGQVEVWDGGQDGIASTDGDNTLFMDQGLFVP
jgi:Tol biopolymer transport system component